MNKTDIVAILLQDKQNQLSHKTATVFAPTNIALCKYWGKRDQILNLPMTSSLSISLGNKGTTTAIKISDTPHDVILLNQQPVHTTSEFYKRLVAFLDLLPERLHFHIDTRSNIPTAAGLASSASGFAALVLALDQLFQWHLTPRALSIFARLGSGSACRSLWHGFVEWHAGTKPDGMDSFAEPLPDIWPDFCVGLIILNEKEKDIGSREAMQRTIETSPFYSQWPHKVNHDLIKIKEAIKNKDFILLAETAESNAMAMHATMMSAWPPVVYALPETIAIMEKIWQLRREGLPIYFTQDAGPNIKLLFLREKMATIQQHFPGVEILSPLDPLPPPVVFGI